MINSFSLNRPSRPNQSICRDGRLCVYLSVCMFPLVCYRLNVFLPTFAKVLGQKNQLQKDFLGKSYKKEVVSDLCNFGSEMVKNCRADFFFFNTIKYFKVHIKTVQTPKRLEIALPGITQTILYIFMAFWIPKGITIKSLVQQLRQFC